MKNLILFILLLGINIKTNAQSISKTDIKESYAVIHDPDGFVNVRQEKSVKSPIVGKIYNENIFINPIRDIKPSQSLKKQFNC